MKQFYTHLIEMQSLIVELDNMTLTDAQKIHLTALIDSSVHHSILDAILSQLKDGEKVIFLNHLKENDHGKIWQFLNSRIDNIEDKIKKTAKELKDELHKDIRRSRQRLGSPEATKEKK